MSPAEVTIPPLITVAELIYYLRFFPQDMYVGKDGSQISKIAIVPADYGQMVSIT